MIRISKPINRNYFEIANKIFLTHDIINFVLGIQEKKKVQITWELRAFLIGQKLLKSVNIENNIITFLNKNFYNFSKSKFIFNDFYSIYEL